MDYVVVYDGMGGDREVFGPFKTLEEAFAWAKSDQEYCCREVEVTPIIGDNKIEVEEYGTWEVCNVHEAL